MMELLKARVASQGTLVWLPSVKATQRSANGLYEVRGTYPQGVMTYHAWRLHTRVPKLLGYAHVPDLARNFCEGHFLDKKAQGVLHANQPTLGYAGELQCADLEPMACPTERT